MHCDCYLRQGTVFLPTTGKADKNVYFLVEPVAVVPVSDTDALRRALRETIARGNPTVKYDRSAPPVLLKYAGVKSWSTFARNARLWVMEEAADVFIVVPYQRGADGSFSPDKTATVTLQNATAPHDLAERMITILQEAARVKSR